MLEKEIERKFGQWCKKQGFLSIKLSSPGRKGVPDRLVLTNKGMVFFVEFKRPGGRLSILQEKTIKEWRELGHEVIVAYSAEQAIDYISNAVHAAQLPRGLDSTSVGESGSGAVPESWVRKDGGYFVGDPHPSSERSGEESACAGATTSVLRRVAPGDTEVGKL